MKKNLLAILLLFISFNAVLAQNPPKREFRGAWVATYFGIDWPNRNQTPQQQRDAFLTIVNHHQQTGIRAMYVQVRSQSDAMYQSNIEPWAFYLTPLKVDGNAPNPVWDPMLFMINECHARGIEFHAWLNPYRAIGNIANIGYFSPNHVARQHPEWLIANGAERILDPGLPDVRNHINNVVEEIVENYDVDGIHFDDYFYPNAAFNDDLTFANHNRGFTNRADWRRDNINLLIQAVSANIKAIKPWVEFGVSPSGIWRNGGAEGSATTGLQHYVSLYADSRKWLQQGWIDYLCPQVYWYINQPGSDYKVLIPWWNNNAFGRLIYIGMAGYKVGDPAQHISWSNRSQIPNQVRMNRDPAYPNIHGQSIYNTSSLRNNPLNFRDSLRLRFYNTPALQPLMPWVDAVAPNPATALTALYSSNTVTLNWTNPPVAINEMDKAKQLVIYRSENPAVDMNNANNILAITPTLVSGFIDNMVQPNKTYYYRITTLDRLHNESSASNQVSICTDEQAPVITFCPPASEFCFDSKGAYQVPTITATDNCGFVSYSYTITGATSRSGTGNDASGTFNLGSSTINWTVTDGAGKTATCQTTVTVYANPTLVIPDAYVLPSGVLANTVYIGYSPASSITLQGNGSGGALPYSYAWSNGSTGSSITVSPTSATNYQLTITDANGCQAMASKDIAVMNITGSKPHKVRICHTAGERTLSLEVGTGAVADHLLHGDMLGSCPEITTLITREKLPVSTEGKNSIHIQASPNPSSSYFTVTIVTDHPGKLMLRVIDIAGRIVEQKDGVRAFQSYRLGGNYSPGIYFIEVMDGKEKQVVKIVRGN